jgi:hypothetical protein
MEVYYVVPIIRDHQNHENLRKHGREITPPDIEKHGIRPPFPSSIIGNLKKHGK